MQGIKEFLLKYRMVLIGAGLGLLTGILLLTIGFFPTLLLVVLVAAGALFGGVSQVREQIVAFFHGLFSGRKNK